MKHESYSRQEFLLVYFSTGKFSHS